MNTLQHFKRSVIHAIDLAIISEPHQLFRNINGNIKNMIYFWVFNTFIVLLRQQPVSNRCEIFRRSPLNLQIQNALLRVMHDGPYFFAAFPRSNRAEHNVLFHKSVEQRERL